MNRELLLEGVGRRYGLGGAPWVLRGVDLALAPGTLTRIEGANGSGKSTLLRLLAGIDAPTEGRITGRPRTAYVPERFPAALPFTAAGYLIHLGSVHGLSRGEAARAAVEWLERLGAAEYARTPMSELSKGSSQKVAVAQALLAEPELLVLDEAWTGLDTAARTELERAVLERRAAGGTVVFVDHDPRRLAGASDVTYAVVDGNVGTVTGSSVPREEACVVVEVQGAPGAEPPVEATRLAVSVEEPRPGPGLGRLRLTVPETHSDTLLRTLLTAHPPWHVVSVGEGRPATRVPPRAPAAAAVDAVADADAGADVDAEVRS
ncbi:ATP-binding cassette domain-containing protein [Streptomyces phaeochromogenes]|uniref:ABC transporter ATP-binding protein n=1 Tax=Streptomyces phaeochromogenes TaxID=1923 RepID=UPI003865BB52|nr:ATP-binding cassette domain-containing protein [Streptomyces phaeochromogenes]